jgi:hypothetical protein
MIPATLPVMMPKELAGFSKSDFLRLWPFSSHSSFSPP